jgi:4-amino-4-deoxy-L-arabinose transferase-like glycosyltransferase
MGEDVLTGEAPRRLRGGLPLLLGIWLLFYGSFTLFAPPLLDDADSVHAEVAREMLLRHDFVTLYANGIRYLEKAPLYYWTMAGSMRVFGATTAAARLPLALSVLLLALLLESFARRMFRSAQAGLYAGLIALSSFGICIFAHINIPDVMVCVLLSAAVYVFYRTEAEGESPPLRWSVLFALVCALDVLTKGLIGIVFPILILAVFLVLTRGVRRAVARCRQLHPSAAMVVFFAVATPWHVLAALANPSQGHPGSLALVQGHWQVPLPTDGNVHGWAWFYFVNEQVLRYLNLRVPRDYDTVPLWLFLGLILVWLMPWSVFLPGALAQALPVASSGWQSRLRKRALSVDERSQLLLIVWAVLPLAFFAFSTRQEYYVLPALPAMILLIAGRLAGPARSLKRASLALVGFGGIVFAACGFVLIHAQKPAPGTDLASLLTQNPGDYALSFGHFLDLNSAALGLFRGPLLLTMIGLPLGCFGFWLPQRRGQVLASTLALTAGALAFLLATHQALATFTPTLSSYALAQAIARAAGPNDLIVIHGEYEAGSTLGFYLRRNDLHILEGRSSNLWYGSFFPDAPRIFETRRSLAAKWLGPQRIFLWQDPQDRDRPILTAAELGAPVYVVARDGGKEILSNQPPR